MKNFLPFFVALLTLSSYSSISAQYPYGAQEVPNVQPVPMQRMPVQPVPVQYVQQAPVQQAPVQPVYPYACTQEVAYANTKEGGYIQLLGGASWLDACHKHNHKHKMNTRHKIGYLAGGAIGYEFCNGLRVEAEYSYRHHHSKVKAPCFASKVDTLSSLRHYTHKKFSTQAIMANLVWNAPVFYNLNTYFGAGAGYAENHVRHRHHETDINLASDSTPSALKKRTRGFAWQGIVGLSFPVACNMDLGIEYRFFQSKKHFHHNDLVFAIKCGY